MYRPHFGREQNRSKKFQELTKSRKNRLRSVECSASIGLFTSAAALEGSMRGPNSEGEIAHERSKYTTTTEHSEGIQEIA